MIGKLIYLPRKKRLFITVLIDIVISVFSIWVAFSLRLEEFIAIHDKWLVLFVSIPLFTIPVFIRSGLYHSLIRDFSLHAVWGIVVATVVSIFLWGCFALLWGIPGFPRSVILISWLVLFALTFLTRFTMHGLLVIHRREQTTNKVAIYGIGKQSVQLMAMLRNHSAYTPVCFIDDGLEKSNVSIQGVKAYRLDQFAQLFEKYELKEVFFSDDTDDEKRKKVTDFLSAYPIKIRSVPSSFDIVKEGLRLNELERMDIEALLGRSRVEANQALLKVGASDRCVMVTGAGGSIGSQLCRHICALQASKLVLVEQSEHALFDISRQLQQEFNSDDSVAIDIIPCLGSIEDVHFISELLTEHSVDIVYHAAAYKHVPLVQENALAGLRNNIVGTKVLAEASGRSKVKHFVLISTDKAVLPTNVMGASKNIAEKIIQVLATKYLQTCFCAVRFGNVLGSSGSVVPIFREQIKKSRVVTVTDPEAERYFMTINEATELVIQASGIAKSGDIFLLDMGTPVRIEDVARKMIHLSGLRLKKSIDDPEGAVVIRHTGLRPGEKLHEQLYSGREPKQTEHPKIMLLDEPSPQPEVFEPIIARIEEQLQLRDTDSVLHLLEELLPSFARENHNERA